MKNLRDIVLEKLKVDDINLNSQLNLLRLRISDFRAFDDKPDLPDGIPLKRFVSKKEIEFYDADGVLQKMKAELYPYYADNGQTKLGGYEVHFSNGNNTVDNIVAEAPDADTALKMLNEWANKLRVPHKEAKWIYNADREGRQFYYDLLA